MSKQQIIRAYRHLYRQGLRAVQFSKPARFILRDRLRLAFRGGSSADFDKQKIANTLEFLRHATTQNGLEHKIVKNLLFVWSIQTKGGTKPRHRNSNQDELEIRTTAFDTLNHNIVMLNESMEMCLPALTIRDPT